MMATHNTPYNPSGNSASFMVLPEQQYGFIDLQTLEDIHRYLRESTLEDDGILANWIQDNYLYEPIGESTRPIHTPEEFSQLDRAYRRVRSLTNKAQDKWPFFDRNFNKMSSSTVRNNARGEAAPGVSYGSLSETHDVHAPTNGNPVTTSISPKPRLQVPFGTKQPGRHQIKQKDISRAAQQTPGPLPTNFQSKSEEQSNSSLSPNPSSVDSNPSQSATKQSLEEVVTTSERKDLHSSTPPQEEKTTQMRARSETSSKESVGDVAVDDKPEVEAKPELELTSSAGSGKVRGPNGRYLPKVVTPSPAAEKSRHKSGSARVKYVKKSKSRESHKVEKTASNKPQTPERDAAHESPASLDEDAVLNPHTSSPSAAQDEPDHIHEDRADSEELNQFHDNTNTSNGSTSSYILAAEADAVASNLDRLPPGLAKRSNHKRKSEPEIQPDTRKRGRFGGLVGRPRKSDLQSAASNQNANKDTEKKLQVLGGETASKMETRRATRRSAAAIDAEVSSQPQKIVRKEKGTEDADNTVVNTTDTIGGHETVQSNPNNAQPDLLAIGLSHTNPPKKGKMSKKPASFSNTPEDVTTTTNSNGADTATYSPGHIEYFARVYTFTGTRDIPIAGDKLDKDENELIQKYAEWMAEEGGADIPFQQFRSIFGFAKKG